MSPGRDEMTAQDPHQPQLFCECASQNCSALLQKWEGVICTEENSLFSLIVQSFQIHLDKVTFISEHYVRSGLNCACCFKWHTKEEHQLWDWLWLRNICPFPNQTIAPLLPCQTIFTWTQMGKLQKKREHPNLKVSITFKNQEMA